MAFEIKNTPILDFEEIAISNTSSKTIIKITTKGALLNSWRILHQGSLFDVINGNKWTKGWEGFEQNGFKGGKMSPFSCRLQQGKYTFNETGYCIEKFYLDQHAIHGIVYDATYQIINTQINENLAAVCLQYDYLGSDKGYPFAFTILVTYSLTIDDHLQIATTILNKCNQAIPIMDGWHPYFTLDTKVDDMEIAFQNEGKVEYNNELIPTGNFIQDETFNQGKLIGNLHLDDCFKLKENSKLTIKGNQIALEMTPLKNYPFLQLYTPSDRQSIAIENLSGIPDCFNNKIGLQILKPNDNIEFITQFKAFNLSL